MGKLTKQQALDKVNKAIDKVAEAGVTRIDANLPKLKASAKQMAEVLKRPGSPDLLDSQSRHLKLQMRAVAEGTTLLEEVIRRIHDFEKDDDLFELVADDLAEDMRQATKYLDDARKELEAGKKLLDQAAKASDQHATDSKEARKLWAEAVAEVDNLCVGSMKEYKAWDEWDKAAAVAVEKRDKKELLRLQKTKPASDALDEVAKQPSGLAFKAFDKEFKRESLAEDLKKEIDRDREASIGPWAKAQMAAKRIREIEVRVAALKIEPRDAAKAIVALGFPPAKKMDVQRALDGPDAALIKSLEAIAKAAKIDFKPAEAMPKLKKAGVL